MSDFLFGRSFASLEATLPGIELAIVPLAAIAAARLRFGADRILALRASRVGPLLPLLMAASLFGLAAYLVWTWVTPRTVFGAEPDFGVLRWLGTVLAAGFAWLWMPLFPRVTATLAGLFAGPALVAIIAYPFMGSCVSFESLHDESGPWLFAILLTSIVTIVWAAGASYLVWARLGIVTRLDGRPMHYAVWSGAIMLGLALFGTLIFTVC